MTKIAFILGEPSADILGAALIRALRGRLGPDVEFTGLGGEAMAREGMRSLFDIHELSIIGLGAVVARLPQLLRRLDQAARHVVAERPDVLVIIDSYLFSHRVARRVKARAPGIAVVNYVPPAIWAHHPERAATMRGYIDRIASLFPFEPAAYAEHGGPDATYVGHPLMREPGLIGVMERRPLDAPPSAPPHLLLLPGSRGGEIKRLLPEFGRTLQLLSKRLPGLTATLPAVPRLKQRIEAEVRTWAVKPEIVSGETAKWEAFAKADAALAASGTVLLELALAGVPMVSTYRLDPLTRSLRHLITGWTGALPNYVVDHPLVPEQFDDLVRPELLARRLHRLMTETPERAAQLAGFAEVRRRMAVERDPAEAAADVVLEALAAKSP